MEKLITKESTCVIIPNASLTTTCTLPNPHRLPPMASKFQLLQRSRSKKRLLPLLNSQNPWQPPTKLSVLMKVNAPTKANAPTKLHLMKNSSATVPSVAVQSVTRLNASAIQKSFAVNSFNNFVTGKAICLLKNARFLPKWNHLTLSKVLAKAFAIPLKMHPLTKHPTDLIKIRTHSNLLLKTILRLNAQ